MASPLTPAADPGSPGLAIPMSDDEAAKWQARIDAAKKAADAKRDEWKPFVSAYMVKATTRTESGDHQVTVPLVYAYTELKKSQLRFQVPEVYLKAKRPEFAGAVRAHEGAVNHELKEAGADAMLDMVTTDVLICGIAGVKVGYYADIRERQVPILVPGPVGPPQVDPMTGQVMPAPPAPEQPLLDPATGQPVMKAEPYVAHECYYGDRLAPENLLFPPEFTGGDYDRAAWLGHRFQVDLETAKRVYNLPPDFAPTATRPQETLSSEEQPEGRDSLSTKDVEGVEIYYQASVYATAPMVRDAKGALVPDPNWEPPRVGQFRRVVFIKNQTQPAVHEDDPAQYVDQADGKLKGRPGNALHVLTLRYLPGACYPVSDVQASFPLTEELNIGRSQMINFRDRVMPVTAVNRTLVDKRLKEQLELGADFKIGKIIGVEGSPAEAIQPVSVAQFPRDNFKFDEVVRGDVELSWSMGRAAAGLTEEGEPVTATEIQAAQNATDTRLAYEQTRFLKWWCRYAEKFGALLQQFKDEPGYAEIVGAEGAKALTAWNRQTIAGEFVYEARPDAALRLDINQERQQALQMYTQLGNDPNVNRVELLKNIATLYNLDPDKVIVAQLPEKGPEPPKISWSFKGEDLSPVDNKTGGVNAQFPLVLAVAQQGGFQFPPEAIQNAMLLGQQIMAAAQQAMLMQPSAPGQPQTEHGGTTTPMPPLNKQVADRTTNGAPQVQ